MTVDLNRLREAMNHEMQESDRRDVLAGVGATVLDAPTVWWCATEREGGAAPIAADAGMVAINGRCGGCGRLPERSGCGWVVLVPVSGGEG